MIKVSKRSRVDPNVGYDTSKQIIHLSLRYRRNSFKIFKVDIFSKLFQGYNLVICHPGNQIIT